jgi:choline dehydrogenase-like flavoprotein
VVVVEEGERWTVERIRGTDPVRRFAGLYRDGGATVALGRPPIALPIGRAVGGTTVVNSGTCYRPPDAVVARWHGEHGLALAEPASLAERLDDVEATVAVARQPMDVIGRNARLALAGAEALGWDAAPLRRNAPGCAGSCQCAIGCPQNAKGGVHLNALPQACAAGARIVSGLRVTRVLVEDGRAAGVRARRADGSVVTLRAPLVVVAGGAVETPALLRRSGLGGHPALGRNLSVHPALGAAGAFDEPVVAWRGVLQSAGIEELHEREGILLEATATPPGMGAMTYPGYGRELVERIARADHSALMGAMIADAPGGRVLGARRTTVVYRLARDDARRLVRALGAMAQVLLAAGARSVELGGGAPPVTATAELPAALDRVRVERLRLAAFHPTGTVAAGADQRRHPADEHAALRGVRGVRVADASILPSCPGVNPQLSIMALAAAAGDAATR